MCYEVAATRIFSPKVTNVGEADWGVFVNIGATYK
jgi:hypothetical protein